MAKVIKGKENLLGKTIEVNSESAVSTKRGKFNFKI
jgi:hypothetical protein